MTKTCVVCGKQFEPKHYNEITCPGNCKRLRHLENMRNSNSHKAKKKVKIYYKGQQCKHKNCKYRASISGMLICNYASMVGHTRGCEAKTCDKYVKKTEPRRKQQICLGV